MCVAIAQINLTIKHIFLSCQLLSTPQNMSPARTRNTIYHPHKTINFLNKGIQSFGILKSQMKLVLKDSSDIH